MSCGQSKHCPESSREPLKMCRQERLRVGDDGKAGWGRETGEKAGCRSTSYMRRSRGGEGRVRPEGSIATPSVFGGS